MALAPEVVLVLELIYIFEYSPRGNIYGISAKANMFMYGVSSRGNDVGSGAN